MDSGTIDSSGMFGALCQAGPRGTRPFLTWKDPKLRGGRKIDNEGEPHDKLQKIEVVPELRCSLPVSDGSEKAGCFGRRGAPLWAVVQSHFSQCYYCKNPMVVRTNYFVLLVCNPRPC